LLCLAGKKEATSPEQSASINTSFIPHPPLSKNKSLSVVVSFIDPFFLSFSVLIRLLFIQPNPKNKFAVLPENSSRGVSPVMDLNSYDQNMNVPNSNLLQSSNTYTGSSSFPKSFQNFSGDINGTPTNTQNSSSYNIPSSSGYKMSSSNRPLPEVNDRRSPSSLINPINLSGSNAYAFPSSASSSNPNSRPNSFDGKSISNYETVSNVLRASQEDKVLDSLFEELDLNNNDKNKNRSTPSGSGNVNSSNNKSLFNINNSSNRTKSTDSWEEELSDPAFGGNFKAPKVKGALSVNASNNMSSSSFYNKSSSTTPSAAAVTNNTNTLPPTPISSSKTR
jgi:hypothetical protein